MGEGDHKIGEVDILHFWLYTIYIWLTIWLITPDYTVYCIYIHCVREENYKIQDKDNKMEGKDIEQDGLVVT